MIYAEETICYQLNQYIEDDFDRLETFGNRNLDNKIPITLNVSNMDFFFPNWRTEADPDNLVETLNELKATLFDTIRVTVVDGVIQGR